MGLSRAQLTMSALNYFKLRLVSRFWRSDAAEVKFPKWI